MKKQYIFLYIIVFLSINVFSQTDESFELNTNHTGNNETFIARDYIKLKNGFEYTAQNNKSFIGKINPNLIFDTDYNDEQTAWTSDLPVGSLPGSVNVSPTGAATYSIPIALPPGTAGIMPNLSINYNSQSAGGMLGKAWTIGGFSAITRVPATMYHDGFVDGVDFDTNDRFALDGQRLIAISGDYGANGTVYHTENESFSKITSFGNSGGGPTKFKVETKYGMTLEFGYTSTSRIEATGKTAVMFWLLDKVKDANGNYYTITYKEVVKDDLELGYRQHYTEFYPDEIKYTRNDGVGLNTYTNSIKFYYSQKNSGGKMLNSWSYVNGSSFENTLLLEKINIYNSNNLIRKYSFNYKFDFYSKLNEIKLHETKSSTINTTKIEWNASQNLFEDETLSEFGTNNTHNDFYSGDFNGDGKSDIFVVKWTYDGDSKKAYKIQYWYSVNGKKFTKHLEESVSLWDFDFTVGDFNADGIDDVAYIGWHFPLVEDNYDFVFKITGVKNNEKKEKYPAYYSTEIPKLFTGDFNGNSKTDVIVSRKSGGLYDFIGREYNNSDDLFYIEEKTSDDILIGDFNGNRKSEIRFAYGDGSIFELGNEKRINLSKNHSKFNKLLSAKGNKTITGDFNGDGNSDIFVYSPNGDMGIIGFSTGDGNFYPKSQNLQDQVIHDDYFKKFIVGDFNGDGKDDILKFMHDIKDQNNPDDDVTVLKIYADIGRYSSKNEYPNTDLPYQMVLIGTKTILGHSSYPIYPNLETGNFDYNGDGRADILLKSSFIGNVRVVFFNPFSKEHHVKLITDGFNNKTNIFYKPITDASVYKKGTGAIFPVSDFQGALYVVKQLWVPTGDVKTKYNFNYESAKIHRQGKGFLGFMKVSSKNLSTNLVSETDFDYNKSYFNTYPIYSKTYYDGDILPIVSSTTISTVTEPIEPPESKIIYTYTESTETKNYLTNITSNSTWEYDDNGNLTRSFVNYINNDNNEDIVEGNTEILYQDYFQYESWLPTKPSKIILKKTAIGKPLYTRQSNFEYFPNGLLKKRIVDPDDVENAVTHEYSYNEFGNITEASIYAPDEERRTTYLSYDNYNRFILTHKNMLGFISSETFDEETGNVLTETDINGHTIKYKYDDFGNLIETELPDGTKAQQSTNWYSSESLVYAKFLNISVTDGEAPLKTYFDRSGRKIRTETVGFNNEKVISNIIYNDKNQLEKISEPHYAPSNKSHSKTSNLRWVEYFYDTYGRQTKVSNPTAGENVYTHYTYNFDNAPKKTKITYPDNTYKISTINSLGQVKEIKDFGGTISYDYNSAGLPITITAPNNAEILITYDNFGNKTSMKDSDTGIIQYNYDVFSNIIKQTDANGNIQELEYDIAGRIKKVTMSEGITRYDYDTALNGKGLLSSEIGINGNSKMYVYDNLSRLSSVVETFESNEYSFNYDYDNFGRLHGVTYPSGFSYTKEYDDNGYLKSILTNDKSVIYENKIMNALGQITEVSKGEDLITSRTYDPISNMPKTVISGTVQDVEYDFKKVNGNLLSRKEHIYGNTENFVYDYDNNNNTLNRLTNVNTNIGENILNIDYDNITENITTGNIINKSDAGIYSYNDDNHVHAVTKVTGDTYLPSQNQTITYNSFNKVNNIIEGYNELNFTYGLDKQRKKTTLKENGNISQTKYFFGSYEKTIDNITGDETEYCYLPSGAIYKITNGTGKLLFSYTDHLGSLTQVTDDEGNILAEQNFDAWGRTRNANDWTYENAELSNITNDRGYTGHEMLPKFGLINMNGRLYDPVLGRMLSPDNYIQAPDFTQNFNRYSYAFNNPLKYTDPSGDFMYATIIGFAVGFYIGGGLEAGQANGVGFDYNPFDGSWKGTGWQKGAIIGAVLGASAGAMIDFNNGNQYGDPVRREQFRNRGKYATANYDVFRKNRRKLKYVPEVDRHREYYAEGSETGNATDGHVPKQLNFKELTASDFIKKGGGTLAEDLVSGAINATLNSFKGMSSSEIHGNESDLYYKYNVNVNGTTIPITNSEWSGSLPLDGVLINVSLNYGMTNGITTSPHGKLTYKMKASALHRTPYETRTIQHPRTRNPDVIHKAKRPWNDALPLSEGGFVSNAVYYKKLYHKSYLEGLFWVLKGMK